jgi:hypothetical protein
VLVGYTGRELLYCAMYVSSCRTANIDRFVDFLNEHKDLDTAIRPAQFGEFTANLATMVDVLGTVQCEEDAQRTLMANDLRHLADVDLAGMELPASVEDAIAEGEPIIRSRLEAIGMKAESSALTIVDQFPPPFDKFDWAAFAPDREDEEEFGIPQGIYFKRERLRPLYSQALYAHEVVHTATGQIDPDVYATGMEEGIAEIVGTCYGGLGVLSPRVLKNILVYGRHGVERPAIWSLYRDHTRQAFLLYCEFGLKGLVALINRGRAAIHRAATAVLDGTYRKLDLPRGDVDEETRDVLQFACLGYVPSHAYSPMECLLTMHVERGRTVKEVCRAAGVDPTVGVAGIESVSAKSALFVIDGDAIGYSNVERLLAAERESDVTLLRYVPAAPVG